MTRFFSFLLILCLISVLALPAAAEGLDWIELLSYGFIPETVDNTFTVNTGGQTISFDVPLPSTMTLSKIDILIKSPGRIPSSVKYGASLYPGTYQYFPLEFSQIGDDYIRIYGTLDEINGKVDTLKLQLTYGSGKATTAQFLTMRVSPIAAEEFVADADVYLDEQYWPIDHHILLMGDGSERIDSNDYLARINVYDWENYDTISIWGSIDQGSIASIRASIGTLSLPITVNYLNPDSSSSWTDFEYDGNSGWAASTDFYDKVLFTVTIDVSNVDRTLAEHDMFVYVSGVYSNALILDFNCQYVNGGIDFADTSNAVWWDRISQLFEEYFGVEGVDPDQVTGDLGDNVEDLGGVSDSLEEVPQADWSNIGSSFGEIIAAVFAGAPFILAVTKTEIVSLMLIVILSCAILRRLLVR